MAKKYCYRRYDVEFAAATRPITKEELVQQQAEEQAEYRAFAEARASVAADLQKPRRSREDDRAHARAAGDECAGI